MQSVTPTAATQKPTASLAVDIAVDAGFGVLLVVCGLRYFAFHELAGTGMLVLALAIASGLSYATAVLGGRRARDGRAPGSGNAPLAQHPAANPQGSGAWQRAWLLAATAIWLPLVVLAPSFGWCAFALFFAIHRVLSGGRALALSATIVVAVSIGLYLMSGGADLGLVLGPFFGGLVLAYAYWALDRALGEQRRLNTELLDTREQLARTERVAGAAAERERVASELHDTVAQRTAEALLRLEAEHAASAGGATSDEARGALRLALTETREFMLGLVTPRAARPAGLTDALRALAGEARATFEVTGTERTLPDEASHALQRVTQEALTNVRKHAAATHTKVTLNYFPDAVGVDIADDGAGFARKAASEGESGFGIRAMGWRIRNLGGTLTIESAPGRGTAVAATVPDAPRAVGVGGAAGSGAGGSASAADVPGGAILAGGAGGIDATTGENFGKEPA
ncbi:sensor histidine kinase [Leucobacter albus]|uniref:Sensor histidine kinase n=1 Tax=Leucobacter albus TaxID=272210 RepID=A0ABW3TN06_9MICO